MTRATSCRNCQDRHRDGSTQYSDINFIKSPAEVEAHRKVDLEDKKIKEETRQEFNKLCDRFDDIRQ